MKVSDYIAQFLADNQICDVFTVVGGGAMHLNDSLGHNPQLRCLYNHHEQASAMAAEAYARVHNRIAALCVTSGPGAINALNGVVGAYQDSIPMLIFSGQTKLPLTVKNSGLKLRTLGNQEFDIVSALDNVVKYSEMIMEPTNIKYCLEKALYIATHGRKGPCWLDIPLDIQGSFVETSALQGYTPKCDGLVKVEHSTVEKILQKLNGAKRPVIYAGNGVRWANATNLLHEFAEKMGIPVVTCWDSIDLIETDNKHYCGRAGIMGDRAGNFAVQNSDVLLCIGTRLNIYQVGYNVKTWARGAYAIVVDIDPEELKKQTIRVDLPVCADARDILRELLSNAKYCVKEKYSKWVEQCNVWKTKYPVVQSKHYVDCELVNVYAFMDTLSRLLPENSTTVVSNGSASVVGSSSYHIKKQSRFIMNCALSSMGYGLPASIGACIANAKQNVICIEGDGSIMMNLQELQTVATNKLPIKIFVINNGGYHQIRQTQNNVFHNALIGIGVDSGDLGFPDFGKLAKAFGVEYKRIVKNSDLSAMINSVLQSNNAVLCEVKVDTAQKFEPKSATKKLEDGSLFSPPLEDLAPFLPREELKSNMYIPLVSE